MKQYTSFRFSILICLLVCVFTLSCRVYHNSQHNETNHTTKEGDSKTIIKKPQQVIITSPFDSDSNNVSIAANNSHKRNILVIDTTYRNLPAPTPSGLYHPYFNQQIKLLLQIEGGYQNDSRDLSNRSGRGTKYGITAETALRFGDFDHLPTSGKMAALTESQAKRIYWSYYQSYHLDHIHSDRLAWLIFDGLVNLPSRVPHLIRHGLNAQGIEAEPTNRWNAAMVEAVNQADSYQLFEDFWNARYAYYEHRTGRLDSSSAMFAYMDSLWNPRLQDAVYLNGWLNRMAHLKARL